jgi:hypothetical protein
MSIEMSGFSVAELRVRLRKMSDAELVRFGRAAKEMCAHEARTGKTPIPDYVEQLVEARAEWRRRHPKQGDEVLKKSEHRK